MRISDWSSDVCSSDLSGVAEQAVDITAFVETFIDPKLKRGSKFRLHALGYLASQIADVAFQSGQHFILIRTQERFYENRCVAQIRGHADFSDADCMGAQHVVMHRSEERRVGKECVSTCRSRWSP